MPVGEDEGKGEGESAADAACSLSRRHLLVDDGVLTADASPEGRAWLSARYPGLPQRLVCPRTLRAAILARHGEALRREAVEGLGRRLPELSARRVLTRGQALLFSLLGAALLAALLAKPLALLRAMVLLLSAAFVASGLFRALLAWLGSGTSARALPLPRHGLPRYTILVPLYREAAVLPGLVRALTRLDYPSIMQQTHLRAS
jgi:hypothetical protein